jgi:hypothetical protein
VLLCLLLSLCEQSLSTSSGLNGWQDASSSSATDDFFGSLGDADAEGDVDLWANLGDNLASIGYQNSAVLGDRGQQLAGDQWRLQVCIRTYTIHMFIQYRLCSMSMCCHARSSSGIQYSTCNVL